MPVFIHVKNPLKPLEDFTPETAPEGYSIEDYLYEKGLPFEGVIAIVDGEKSEIYFWSQPLPASARVIITPQVGSTGLIVAIVLIAIAVALFFFLPPPISDSVEEADSVYTLKGQKNQKRLNQPIEKHYGRMRVFPSYMANPFTTFENDNQYLYALFCLGLGKYENHNIKIEDTDIDDFDNVQYEIYEPGEQVRLFPTNVQTSGEVGGIELMGENEAGSSEWYGPFASSSPGSKSYRIQIDIAFRSGLYRLNSEGKRRDATCSGLFQARLIDDDGTALDDWFDLSNIGGSNTFVYTDDSIDAILKTFSFTVPDGRYEVRGQRTNDKNESIKYRDVVHWEALRTFNETEQNFGNVTLLAVIAKASNNLNDSSKSAFNVEQTSILPVYNSDTSTWTEESTRNPIWATCDVVRANYGKYISDRFLDMPTLSNLANDYDDELIRFDGTFDTGGTIWPVISSILSVGRAVPVIRGGLISAVRDVPNVVPTLGFSGNNIVKNSMAVTTRIVNFSEHDGIEVQYVDGNDWKTKTVTCLVGTDRGISLKQVKLLGCTNRNRAYRWGMYQRACEVYQTDNFNFETGLEGGTAIFGDLIAVKHETLPSENDFVEMNSARIVGLTFETILGDSVTVLELPFAPVFEIGETYRIALRDKIGVIHGPYACTAHASNPNKVVLEVALDDELFEVPTNAEKAMYFFGISGTEYTLAKITKIEPGGSEDTVKITAIPYREEIYTFDMAEAPLAGEQFTTPDLPSLPVVTGVNVIPFPGSRSEVTISWNPAAGATSYFIQKSLNGTDWRDVGTVLYSGFVLPVESGSLWVRVRGINKGAGPWDSWTGTVGTPTTLADPPENTRLASPFELTMNLTWDGEPLADSYRVRVFIGATQIILKEVFEEFATFDKTYLQSKATAAGATMTRDFNVTVESDNNVGNSAQSPVTLISNPLPPAVSAFLVGTPTGSNYPCTWTHYKEDDFANYKVYASTTTGFTPGGGNLLSSPTAQALTIAAPVRPLYVKIEALDSWGSVGTMSAQFVIP